MKFDDFDGRSLFAVSILDLDAGGKVGSIKTKGFEWLVSVGCRKAELSSRYMANTAPRFTVATKPRASFLALKPFSQPVGQGKSAG